MWMRSSRPVSSTPFLHAPREHLGDALEPADTRAPRRPRGSRHRGARGVRRASRARARRVSPSSRRSGRASRAPLQHAPRAASRRTRSRRRSAPHRRRARRVAHVLRAAACRASRATSSRCVARRTSTSSGKPVASRASAASQRAALMRECSGRSPSTSRNRRSASIASGEWRVIASSRRDRALIGVVVRRVGERERARDRVADGDQRVPVLAAEEPVAGRRRADRRERAGQGVGSPCASEADRQVELPRAAADPVAAADGARCGDRRGRRPTSRIVDSIGIGAGSVGELDRAARRVRCWPASPSVTSTSAASLHDRGRDRPRTTSRARRGLACRGSRRAACADGASCRRASGDAVEPDEASDVLAGRRVGIGDPIEHGVAHARGSHGAALDERDEQPRGVDADVLVDPLGRELRELERALAPEPRRRRGSARTSPPRRCRATSSSRASRPGSASIARSAASAPPAASTHAVSANVCASQRHSRAFASGGRSPMRSHLHAALSSSASKRSSSAREPVELARDVDDRIGAAEQRGTRMHARVCLARRRAPPRGRSPARRRQARARSAGPCGCTSRSCGAAPDRAPCASAAAARRPARSAR